MKNYADWHPYMKDIGGRLKNNCGHSLQLKILRQKPAAQPILVILFGAAFLVSYCLVHTAAKPGNNWTKVKVFSLSLFIDYCAYVHVMILNPI